MSPTLLVGALLGIACGSGLLLMLVSLTGGRQAPRRRRQGPIAGLLARADLARVTSTSVVSVCLAASLVVGAAALLVTAVPTVALMAAVVAGSAPILMLRRRAARRQQALRGSWPDAVDALISGVRAGMSLPEAVSDLARHGPEPLRAAFGDFAAEYRATGSFASALAALQDRLADHVADRVVAALRIARDVGGSDLGVVLRTLSALLRENARMRGEIEARQSWTVSAAKLAVAAPWVTLALLCTRPDAVRAYSSAGGAGVLLLAAALSFIAYRVMLRIGRLPSEPRMAA